MYTNTNPELRRIVPDSKGRTKVKVVYVVLEAQYQSALTKAVQNLNAKRENVSLLHLQWFTALMQRCTVLKVLFIKFCSTRNIMGT